MNPLLTASAREIARQIKDGETTAVDVIDAHIERIQEVEPTLRALARERFVAARDEAREADMRTAGSKKAELGALHGVPVTIQEGVAVHGMPHTGGRKARSGAIAAEDATVVTRLRKAGAIVLAVTNTGDSVLSMECENPIYGRTINPFDPRCMAGPGAGGEGALVGSGGSPVGIGVDLAGGIRIPALFSGVFAHKPSAGLIPSTGCAGLPGGDANAYACLGPITRHAEDLLPLLRIMAGPDGEDHTCKPMTVGPELELDIKKLVVVDCPEDDIHEVRDDMRVSQQVCVNLLLDHGAIFKFSRFPQLKHAFEIWSAMIDLSSGNDMLKLLFDPTRRKGAAAAVASLASPHTLPTLLTTVRERLASLDGTKRTELVAMADDLRAAMEDIMEETGVIFFPAFNTPAPRHKTSMFKPMGWTMAAIANVLGFPATQVPSGFDPTGLPLGVQIIGRPGMDNLTIAVARFLEPEVRGWRIS